MEMKRFLWSFVNDKPILNWWGKHFIPYDSKGKINSVGKFTAIRYRRDAHGPQVH